MKHPYKQSKLKGRKIDEHRKVMELHLGRRLGRFEFVHHINEDKRDNRLDNLEVVSPKEHAAAHGQWKHPTEKRCSHCGCTFTPHPTKRARALTCSRECRYARLSLVNRRPELPHSKYR